MHHVHEKICRQHQQGGECVSQLFRRDWWINLSSDGVDSTAVIPHSPTHTPQKRPVVPTMGQHLEIQPNRMLSRIQYPAHTLANIHSRFNAFLILLSKTGESCVLNIVYLHGYSADMSVWFFVGRRGQYHGPSEMYSSFIK